MKYLLMILFIIQFKAIFAETIILKDNQEIHGKIKNQGINSIKVEVKGEIQEIPKDKIFKIVYRDTKKTEEENPKPEDLDKSKIAAPQNLEDEKLNRNAKDTPVEQNNPELKDEEPKTVAKEIEPNREEKPVTAPEPSKKEEPKKNYPSRLAATGCSVVLPGCGQFMERRYVAGVLYPLLLIAGGGLIYNENQKHKSAVKNYDSFSNPILLTGLLLNSSVAPPPTENTLFLFYSQRSSAMNSHVSSARNIGYGVALIYLFNIFDAYFFYNENAFAENRTRGFFLDYQLLANQSLTSISHSTNRYDQFYTLGYSFQF